MKFKKKIMLLLIITVTLFVEMNGVKAETSGSGSGQNDSIGSTGRGCWEPSDGNNATGFGIKITVKSNSQNFYEFYSVSDLKITNQWIKKVKSGVYDYKPNILYDKLNIPHDTTSNNYKEILKKAKSIKGSNLEDDDLIFIEPYTICSGEKVLIRTSGRGGVSNFCKNKNYNNVCALLANSVVNGTSIAGYTTPKKTCYGISSKGTPYWYPSSCGLNKNIKTGYGIVVLKYSDIAYKTKITVNKKKNINGTTTNWTKNGNPGNVTFRVTTNSNCTGGQSYTFNNENSHTFTFTYDNNDKKTYYICETDVPSGWTKENKKTLKNIKPKQGSGNSKTVTFTNTKTDVPGPGCTGDDCCTEELKEISGLEYSKTYGGVEIYKFSGETNQTLAELIDLYYKYGAKYNDLLMFDKKAVACSSTTIGTYEEPSCNKNDYLKFSFKKDIAGHVFGDTRKIGRNASYGTNSLWGGIEYNFYTFCHISNFSIDSNIIKSNASTSNGLAIWNSDRDIVANGNLTIDCYEYMPKYIVDANMKNTDSSGNIKWIYHNWGEVENRIKGLVSEIEEIKLDLGDSLGNASVAIEIPKKEYGYCVSDWKVGDTYTTIPDDYCTKGARDDVYGMSGGATIWSKTYEINFNFKYPKKIKYIKSTGTFIVGDTDLPYIETGYGFPTKMGEVGNFKQKFSLILPDGILKNYFNINTSEATCDYTTTEELIPCVEGTGDPECPPGGTKDLNLEFRIIDTKKPFPGINGEGRTAGSNWNNGTVIDNEIKNANNSYNIKNKDPLISIRLTPNNIEAISSKYNGYNKDHSYDDFELDCTDGKECTSSFVTRLLNGEFGAVEGSCEKGPSRKYCVGES